MNENIFILENKILKLKNQFKEEDLLLFCLAIADSFLAHTCFHLSYITGSPLLI